MGDHPLLLTRLSRARLMCDAGQNYQGCLSKEEIFEQIDFLVKTLPPGKSQSSGRFSLHEWVNRFNPAVLDVLEELPARYEAPDSCLPFHHRSTFL